MTAMSQVNIRCFEALSHSARTIGTLTHRGNLRTHDLRLDSCSQQLALAQCQTGVSGVAKSSRTISATSRPHIVPEPSPATSFTRYSSFTIVHHLAAAQQASRSD